MPELPEVETIARGVHELLRGDRIVQAWFGSHREPFKTPPLRQAKGLEGRSVLAVHRTGKHIVFELGPQERCTMLPRGKPPRTQKKLHSAGRAVDRAPGHDRAAAGYHPGFSRCSSHARAAQPGQRPGTALCGSATLRPPRIPQPAQRCAFHGPGAEPLTIGAREFAALFHDGA